MPLVKRVACGLLAGAVGTLAMDLALYAGYRRGGGDASFLKWEFASAPDTWDKASAPANVGKLLYETATHQTLAEDRIGITTNVMHWAYGKQWGAILAFGIGSPIHLKLIHGPLLGALVWLASYVSLPIAGFYKPIWRYDLKTLCSDLGPHLVYGAATVGAYRVACRTACKS